MSVLIINNLDSTLNFDNYIVNLEPKQYVILSAENFSDLICNCDKFKELIDKKYVTCVTTNKINLSSNKTINSTNNTTNIDNNVVITTANVVDINAELESKIEEPKADVKPTKRSGRKKRLVENK